ncbi:ParB N-terminal domain-containing protein [Crateriforma conspicua]|uniref:hypothetical protein n=1 Tax=Crateriforma conspicua TaxID=2527996 RepID=UPI00118BDA4F|nr:hypothetical protein [Crateriforma conspicua]QDV66160.1 hypothetical protein Mal65_53350 [Crateriforma conspicua]
MSDLQVHPIANIFPMMDAVSFEALKADIKSCEGVDEPGLLYEGKILDGRNRYKACQELGLQMRWQEVELADPDEADAFDPYQHVMTHNLHRRHLKQTQRAMIAAKLATLKQGQKASNDVLSIDDAAVMLNVSPKSVDRAKHVVANGSKPLIEAVEACDITVSMAEKLCKACDNKREQSRLVKEGKKAIKEWLEPPADEAGNGSGDDHDGSVQSQTDTPEAETVAAFKRTESRMMTMRMLVNELADHEVSVLRELLESRLADCGGGQG